MAPKNLEQVSVTGHHIDNIEHLFFLMDSLYSYTFVNIFPLI